MHILLCTTSASLSTLKTHSTFTRFQNSTCEQVRHILSRWHVLHSILMSRNLQQWNTEAGPATLILVLVCYMGDLLPLHASSSIADCPFGVLPLARPQLVSFNVLVRSLPPYLLKQRRLYTELSSSHPTQSTIPRALCCLPWLAPHPQHRLHHLTSRPETCWRDRVPS